MIQVQGLTKYYGRQRAIEELAFHADRGEILGFLGPNGAGKTTTMRILTGYMPPTSGSATIDGYDVIEDSLAVRQRIGYLPETVPLYPDMTVVEYLEYMGALRDVDPLPKRIDQLLEEVHLTDRAGDFIGGLSKGLRQRVGLAQALIHEPMVLILDEPTIGLDPAQIIEVREMVRSLGEDRTVLLSTHILSEAQQVCDRVLIINNGRIVAEDSPHNLQAQLTGGDRFLVRLRGDQEGLADRLRELAGVREVSEGEDEGVFQVLSDPGEECRPAVARSLIEAGAHLLEMRSVGYSLEEVFLKLTREGDASGAAE